MFWMAVFLFWVFMIVILVSQRKKKPISPTIKTLTLKIESIEDLNSSEFKPIGIVIDTETTGLFIDNSIIATSKNISDWPENFPYVLQIGFMLFEKTGRYYGDSFIIKHELPIPERAIEIHGITNDKCKSEGIDISEAIKILTAAASKVYMVIGYNLGYDIKIIKTACIRSGLEFPFTHHERYDLMTRVAYYLYGDYQYMVRLDSAFQDMISDKGFADRIMAQCTSHDAYFDAYKTMLIYIEYRSKKGDYNNLV